MKLMKLMKIMGVVAFMAAVAVNAAEIHEKLTLNKAPEGTFTLAVIPDTQRYHGAATRKGNTNNPASNPAFESRVSWLAGNLNEQKIVFVSHVGDIVDRNNAIQWDLAKSLMGRLHGRVPYGISVGNHDLKTRGDSSLFQEHFGSERFKEFTWYGGTYAGCPGQAPRISGNNANSFQLFSAGGLDFVILHIECNAPDDVLAWADGVLDSHAKRMAIITTHMCLGPVAKPRTKAIRTNKDGLGRMCWKKVHSTRGNTPQQMWEKCFSQHPNLFLVLAGDQSSVIAARLESRGTNGNVVHQVMQDYPRRTDQDDWVRLYRFNPAQKKIRVITYSPCQERLCDGIGYLPDIADHQFDLDISDALGRHR